MKKSNILVLIEKYGTGGAEKLSSMLAQELCMQTDFNVYFCTVYSDIPQNPYPNDATPISLNVRRSMNILGKLFNYALKIRRLAAIKSELKIDLSISTLWPTDWINIITGRDKKIAIIVINILNNIQNIKMVNYRQFVSWIYNKADRVVVCSNSIFEEMETYFRVDGSLLKVIRNSINTSTINNNLAQPLNQALQHLFCKNSVIITVARLSEIKNTISLISIVARVLISEPVKLLIVGEGDQESAIKEQLNKLKLAYTDIRYGEDKTDEHAIVYFLTFQSNIHNLIANSKIFVLPSKGEGVPLALLEAMYCKVPVLVSDCPNGGPAEVLENAWSSTFEDRTMPKETASGYLMPVPNSNDVKSIDQWSDAILDLLRDKVKARAMAVSAHTIASDYSTTRIIPVWISEINRLLGSARSHPRHTRITR